MKLSVVESYIKLNIYLSRILLLKNLNPIRIILYFKEKSHTKY
jgi:hypothetical protein